MSTGGSGYDPDKRKRCSHCGQVLSSEKGFRKWWRNSFIGQILVPVLGSCMAALFMVGTIVPWIGDGNAWGDSLLSEEHRTLAQCVWLNLQYLWDVIAHKLV